VSEGYPYAVIAVGDRPMCIWDYDLKEHNERFCSTLNGHWFSESIDRLVEASATDDELSQSAALSIRLTYHHALETFFAVLFAAIQAPECLPGWLDHYQLSDLRQLIRRVQHRGRILNSWGKPSLDWKSISKLVHGCSGWDDDDQTALRFASAWGRLAGEFLDEKNRGEYNGVKHGFRATPGGGGLRIGEEEEYGVPAPPEAMHWLGSSRYGSSSFVTAPIPANRSRRKASHFLLKSEQVLWLPETTVAKAHILSMSIANTLSAVRAALGAPPSTVKFHRFADPEGFEAAWRSSTGVTGFQFNFMPPPDEVAEIDDERLLELLREKSGWTDPPEAAS
jgi:hypothetical protein